MKKLIIANWKMNTVISDAMILAESIKNGVEGLNIDVVLCPPFVFIYPIFETVEKSNIKLGAQDIFWENFGAYTGEISAPMVNNVCQYVIIGHSERRKYFNETDDMINKKVHAALKNNLKPIICVGENTKGENIELIVDQLVSALREVDKEQANNLVIAYEPVWAIGTGEAATGEYANKITEFLRNKMSELFGQETSQQVPILYGGSVDSKNINEFLSQTQINGALVGGASLKANEFIKICKIAEE